MGTIIKEIYMVKRYDSDLDDYLETYNTFWKYFVENPDGSLNSDQIKRELHDFKTLMTNIGIVYDHVTMGKVSKPLTDPNVVCQVADETYQDLYDDIIKDYENIIAELEGYNK
jgi:hypothetical protein